jgi:hypothetical protein
MNEFIPARLGGRVKLITITIITVCTLAFCALIAFGLLHAQMGMSIGGPSWLIVAFISLVVFLFWWYLGWRLKPRAYVLDKDHMIIKRSSPYDDRYFQLTRETKVEVIERMPSFCMHLWSASMPFSMSGSYYSLGMGYFKAYTTSNNRCVMLDNGKKRLILSPENPEQFVMMVRQYLSGLG